MDDTTLAQDLDRLALNSGEAPQKPGDTYQKVPGYFYFLQFTKILAKLTESSSPLEGEQA